jgi:hypothetical protein
VLPYMPSSKRLTLSGTLKRKDGHVSGTENFTVRLFRQKSGGEPLYTERFWKKYSMGIPVDAGQWSLQLGTGDSEGDLTELAHLAKSLYVEIWIGPPSYQELAMERFPMDAVYHTIQTAIENKDIE